MIKDKVVIITGASSGIGEATARVLAAQGAKLVLGARRGDRLRQLSDEIARSAAQLRAQRRGLTLSNAIVLATAQTTGRILVTRNTHAFPAQMPGIRVPYSLEEG